MLNCIEINPASPAIGSVIWLHGLGASGNDFVPIIPELNLPDHLPIRFVFPQAPLRPITVNNGYVMPGWYDITSLGLDQVIDEKGIADSVNLLKELIAHEEARGIPAEKIVLAGFSQGAVIALITGLTFTRSLAGILALSGYLPHADKVLEKSTPFHRKIPIFIAHGTHDTIIPYPIGEAGYQVLKEAGFNAAWHLYSMAHSVCQPEIEDIAIWFNNIF